MFALNNWHSVASTTGKKHGQLMKAASTRTVRLVLDGALYKALMALAQAESRSVPGQLRVLIARGVAAPPTKALETATP